jgi:hypothetical protein
MLNRRAFLMAIGAVGVAQAVRAVDVEDDPIRALLRRRVDVEKRSVGMAVCVVTRDRKRFAAWGRERLSSFRPILPRSFVPAENKLCGRLGCICRNRNQFVRVCH